MRTILLSLLSACLLGLSMFVGPANACSRDAYGDCLPPGQPLPSGGIELICTRLLQDYDQVIEVLVFDRYGRRLNLNRDNHRLVKGPDDTFCIGKETFFSQAVLIVWCNDDFHSVFGPRVIARYLAQGGTLPGRFVDLQYREGGRLKNVAVGVPFYTVPERYYGF